MYIYIYIYIHIHTHIEWRLKSAVGGALTLRGAGALAGLACRLAGRALRGTGRPIGATQLDPTPSYHI